MSRCDRIRWRLGVLAASFALALVGAAAAQPQPGTLPPATVTERDHLYLVGSSTVQPYAEAVSKALLRDYEVPPPKFDLMGATPGIVKFCGGIGAAYPDIIGSGRRMHKAEFDTCVANGVDDIVEIRIGLTPLYMVTKKGYPVFDITPRMIYRGLALETPHEGEFAENHVKTWRELGRSAPDLPIHVLLPTAASASRHDFDDWFLEGGCRHIKEIDAIFSAANRVPKCVTLRTDGVVTEIEEPIGPKLMAVLDQSLPGTLALMTGELYDQYRAEVDPLPVGGVAPTEEAVNALDYAMASSVFFYFKKGHMRDRAGRGVVRGIREFMIELTTDEMIAYDGILDRLGLVSLRAEEIEAERRKVRTLKRFVYE
jgi:phosphate transport system substrate-binding protein